MDDLPICFPMTQIEHASKAWKRMLLLQNAAKFTKESSDLKSIYLTFIRTVLEQSALVWHSSLSKESMNALERIQKSAVRLIMAKGM